MVRQAVLLAVQLSPAALLAITDDIDGKKLTPLINKDNDDFKQVAMSITKDSLLFIHSRILKEFLRFTHTVESC